MILLLYLFFPHQVIYADSCFDMNEIDITSSMIKRLHIEHYILVSVTCHSPRAVSNLRILSKRNYIGVYYSFKELLRYLHSGHLPHVRTLVTIKAGDNAELREVMGVIKKLSDEHLFMHFSWMLILPQNHIEFTRENFHLTLDAKFFLVDKSEIKELYQIRRKSKFTHSHFGNWSEEKGLISRKEMFYERRDNLNGEVLRMMTNNQRRCRFPAECYHLEVWEDFEKILNFTTEYVTLDDVAKNDQLIPDATSNISTVHSLISETHHVIAPILKQNAHLYIRQIDIDEEQWDSYIRPFSNILWVVIFIWIILSSIAITFIAWSASNTLSLKGFTLFDQALTPISAICNQANMYLPTILSSRIARLSAYVVSAVIFPAYSASLISSLSVNIPFIPFIDFETFVSHGRYKMTALDTIFTRALFRRPKDPVIQTIAKYHLVPIEDFPEDSNATLGIICAPDDIAVIGYNYRLLELKAPCKILRVSDTIFDLMAGIELFNEGIRFKQLFNSKLPRFHSSGILRKLQKHCFGPMNIEYEAEFEAINIMEIKSVAPLFLLGILFTLILFIGEILYHNAKGSGYFNRPKKLTVKTAKWGQRSVEMPHLRWADEIRNTASALWYDKAQEKEKWQELREPFVLEWTRKRSQEKFSPKMYKKLFNYNK